MNPEVWRQLADELRQFVNKRVHRLVRQVFNREIHEGAKTM